MVNDIKKIELHLHLDGSVMLDIAKKITNEEDLESKMITTNAKSLKEYLTKFDLPIDIMQTKESLELISRSLVNKLEKDNVIYAEIRFCPLFHIKKGLTLDEVIESVLKGLESNKVKTNLILCMMRGFNQEDNLKIIELAEKYLNNGVCAIDLAGDEKGFKLVEHRSLFELAKEKNIPFTIHAGEVDSVDVTEAIDIGTKRIGHGIKSISEQLEIIKDKDILLEVCPTSNIDTKAFNTYKEHNIYDLYKKGINISINTDNMTVSNIDLNKEYQNLIDTFGFTIEDLKNINKNAVRFTFYNNKEELLDMLN